MKSKIFKKFMGSFLALAMVISLLPAVTLFANAVGTTETFESCTIGAASFISNTKTFNLTPDGSFAVDFLESEGHGCGYNSSSYFIDNYNSAGSSITYKITPSTGVFSVKSLYLYPSNSTTGDTNQTSSVNVTFTGKISGQTDPVFTYTPASSLFSSASYTNATNRGFSLVDFSVPGYDNKAIDELDITLGGTTVYFAIDNFTWDTAIVNSAPTLDATVATPTFTENGSAVDLFSNVAADTKDSGQTFSGMTLTVSNVTDTKEYLSIGGTDVELTNGKSGTITGIGSYAVAVSSNTATVTLSGMTRDNTQMGALIEGITYKNTSDNPSTTNNRAIKITGITDSGTSSNSASPNITATVSVTAVNDASTVKTNAGITVNEASVDNAIAKSNLEIADVDNASTAITYTLTAVPANGILKKSSSALAVNGTFTQDDINNSKITYTHDGSETTSDSFKFTASDGIASMSETTFAITVTPINDAPTVTIDFPTISYSDTAEADTFSNKTGKISATDVDGSISYYGIDGDTGTGPDGYTYNAVTYNSKKAGIYGTLYVKSVTGDYLFVPDSTKINAVTSNQSETFTVTATDTGDAMGNNQMIGSATLTVSFTGANDKPTNISLSNASVDQSAGTNATVGSLSTTDADSGQTYTYSLVKGDNTNDKDNALFTISGTSLIAKNPATMADGTYNVYISTSDGTATYDKAFTVTVTDNVAPTVTSVNVPGSGTYKAGQDMNFTVNFSEDVTVKTAGGTPSVTLTIGTDARYATYQSGSGTTALVFKYTVQSGDDSKGNGIGMSGAALATNSGTIQDAAGNDANLDLNSVGDRDNVKVDAVVPNTPTVSISEDTGASNDGDTKTTSQTITVSGETGTSVDLDFGDGSAHTAGTIAGGSFTSASHTYASGSYTISATLTDAAGNISTAGTKVIVIDTTAPSVTTSADQSISTSAATNDATICALTATDATNISGFTDAITWTITGGLDCGNFSISGTDLKISNGGGLGEGTYVLDVSATDTAGNTGTITLSVHVVNGPTVNSDSQSYTDTAANDTFANKTGMISATATSGSITVYGISGAATGTYLSGAYDRSKAGTYGNLYVKSTTGAYVYVPSSDAALNELTATVTDTFTIEATDGGGTAGNTLTITINGVNDKPTLDVPSVAAYTDTAAANTFSNNAGTLSGGDRDSGAALSYGISSGGTGANIDGTDYDVSKDGTYGTLYVKISGAYVFVPNNSAINALSSDQSETFTVSVSDGTLSATQTFTVSITAANDTPTVTSGDSADFVENGTGPVYTATGTDTDASDTLTFSISGTDAGLFTIDGSTGVLTFKTAPNFEDKKDVGADNVYNLTVTATDNGTGKLTGTKNIAITVTNVNETPVISTGAAVSVTEGSTAAFTPAASDPEGSSISWSISGGADAAKFSIVSGVVTFATAPSFSTPTDDGANNTYEIIIQVSDGSIAATKTVTVTVTQQVSGGTTTGSAAVIVNGQTKDAGTSATSTNSGGQSVTTVTVDDTKLDKILESSGANPTVTLPSTGSDVTVGELSGQTIKNMENKEAVLEIKTDSVTYTLPATEINIDAVSSHLGSQVALKDIKVSVSIAEPSADTVKIVEDTANKNSYQLIVKPVEFTITCTSGGRTVDVSKFNGYVERTVAIPDGIDPSKITTGIVLNADGTFTHVPTQIVKIDGKYFAKINSLTNSTYSVIYNPVEFADVANHWAKTAINDMGSRMVVTGVGSSTYEPDRSITRAEFAAVIVRALGLQKGTTESAFGDVALTNWFNGYVDTATTYSLITGYDSASYGPNDTITREQAMAIIARAMKLTDLSVSLTDSEVNALLAKYTDGATVSDYAKTSAAICLKSGVVTGSSATTLSPKAYVTRAEVAVMVQRMLQKSGLI